MRWITTIFFIVLLGLIQNSFLRVISVKGIRPDLLLLFALYLGLYGRREDVVVGSWLAGLCKDFLTIGPIGAFAVLFLLFGLLMARTREALFREHPLTQMILVFLAVLFLNTIFLIPLSIYFHLKNFPLLLLQAAGVALYSALLAPLCFFLFTKLRGLLGIGLERSV
jgi:rod shape-determining protein MreD